MLQYDLGYNMNFAYFCIKLAREDEKEICFKITEEGRHTL